MQTDRKLETQRHETKTHRQLNKEPGTARKKNRSEMRQLTSVALTWKSDSFFYFHFLRKPSATLTKVRDTNSTTSHPTSSPTLTQISLDWLSTPRRRARSTLSSVGPPLVTPHSAWQRETPAESPPLTSDTSTERSARLCAQTWETQAEVRRSQAVLAPPTCTAEWSWPGRSL